MLDAELMLRAKKETEFHRSQIQGFLYGPGKGPYQGWHTVRDCTKPYRDQVIWREYGFKYDYEKLDQKMTDLIELEEMKIILAKYDELHHQ